MFFSHHSFVSPFISLCAPMVAHSRNSSAHLYYIFVRPTLFVPCWLVQPYFWLPCLPVIPLLCVSVQPSWYHCLVGFDTFLPSCGCRRTGNDLITIVGRNFGDRGALVFISGQECKNVTHVISDLNSGTSSRHREVTCLTPGQLLPFDYSPTGEAQNPLATSD